MRPRDVLAPLALIAVWLGACGNAAPGAEPAARMPASRVPASRAPERPAPAPAVAIAPVTTVPAKPRQLDAGLQEEVRRLIASTGPRRGVSSVSVRDPDGHEVASVRGDEPLMPASNQKLLTTGAALRTLGPDFTFQTRLLRDGDRLVVVGDGDPAFGDPELLQHMTWTDPQGNTRTGMTIDALIDLWADAARQAGLSRVRELVIDDRVFDRSTCHADWPVDQLHEDYCAEVSGLNFHLNCLSVWAAPSPRGAVVTRTEPGGDFVRIENRTAPGKEKRDGIWLHREPDENLFIMRGFLRRPLQAPVDVTVSDPAAFFGRFLADRLRKAGVMVDSVRLALPAEPVPSGEAVGPVVRTPLRTALTRCNTDSQNLYAESLLKRVGHAVSAAPGTWENGTDAMQRLVAARVGGAAGLEAADGSGLSRRNRVTTSVLSGWIQDLTADPALSDPFVMSLAVGGRNGTVRKRFGDIDPRLATVRCKTGYIDGVSALSGVVDCTNGYRVPFSVVSNGFEAGGVTRARQLQEAVVKAIVRAYARRPTRQAREERPALGGG